MSGSAGSVLGTVTDFPLRIVTKHRLPVLLGSPRQRHRFYVLVMAVGCRWRESLIETVWNDAIRDRRRFRSLNIPSGEKYPKTRTVRWELSLCRYLANGYSLDVTTAV